MNLRTFALGALAVIGLGAAFGAAQTSRNPLRYIPPPADFYQSPAGSDGNTCTLSAPCLTPQHTVNYALTQYDAIGSNITVHLAGGQTINSGILIGGPLPGGAGATTLGGALTILGAGSGTTVINNTTCGNTTAGISVGGGAFVKIGSMSIGSTCGSDILVQQSSTVYLTDSDVKLTAASYAQVHVYAHSLFHGNIFNLGLSGNATYAFAGSTYGVIQLGQNSVLTVTGTPTYSAFIDLIDGSMFDPGLGTVISASGVVGTKYSLNLNSFIDMEDVLLSVIPGDVQGDVANGSYVFTNTGVLGACVGGAVGCRVTTAPTGGGTDAAYAMGVGSGDSAGVVAVTAGTGAASTGAVHVATPSSVAGPGHQHGYCTASLWGSTMNWDPLASVVPYYVGGDLMLTWQNNSVALTNGQTYALSYGCQ